MSINGIRLAAWRSQLNLDIVQHQITDRDGEDITQGIAEFDDPETIILDVERSRINGEPIAVRYDGPGAGDGLTPIRDTESFSTLNVTTTGSQIGTRVSFSTVAENPSPGGPAPTPTGELAAAPDTSKEQGVVGTATFDLVSTDARTTDIRELTVDAAYREYNPPQLDSAFEIKDIAVTDSGFNTPLKVAVTVTNAGTDTATGEIQYGVTNSTGVGQYTARQPVTLDGGGQQTVTFTGPVTTPDNIETYTARAQFGTDAATIDETITEPASLSLDDVTIVESGFTDPLKTEIRVSNAGGDTTETLTYEVTREGESTPVYTETANIALSKGESQTVTFTQPVTSTAGNWTATATFDGEALSDTVEIIEPPSFNLVDVSIVSGDIGQPLVTNVTVSNTGGEGSSAVEYRLRRDGDPQTIEVETLNLSKGSQRTVVFDAYEIKTAGNWTAAATFAGETKTDTIEVARKANLTVTNVSITQAEFDEQLQTKVEVTNVGGRSGTGDVVFDVSPTEFEAQQSVTQLGAGDTDTLVFTGPRAQPDGKLTYTAVANISGSQGSDSTVVRQDPVLVVDSVSVLSAGFNETLRAQVVVRNDAGNGGKQGTGTINYEVRNEAGQIVQTGTATATVAAAQQNQTVFTGPVTTPVGKEEYTVRAVLAQNSSSLKTDTVTVRESPDLVLADTSIITPTGSDGFDEPLRTNVTVRNDAAQGGQQETAEITYTVTKSTTTIQTLTETVTLDAAESQTVTLNGVRPTPTGNAEYITTAEFAGESQTDAVTIREPANVVLDGIDVTGTYNDSVTATVSVSNTNGVGGENATDVQLSVEFTPGTTVEKTITIPADTAGKQIQLTGPEISHTGIKTYEATATVAGQTATDSVTVKEPARPALVDVNITDAGYNESITTAVKVRNDGARQLTEIIDYNIPRAGTSTEIFKTTRQVVLNPGETQTVNFTGGGTITQAGTYIASATFAGQKEDSVEIVEPADLVLNALSITDETVSFGDPLTTNVTVTNVGGRTGTAPVTYTVVEDSTQDYIQTQTVTLNPGETQHLVFDGYRPRPNGTAVYTARATVDGGPPLTASRQVVEPAQPSLTDVTITNAEYGTPLNTTVTVTNNAGPGGNTATETISFDVTPGTSPADQDVTLTPGETQTVTFTGPTPTPTGSQTYTAEATFGPDTQTDTATVKEIPRLTITDVTVETATYGADMVTDVTVTNTGSNGGQTGTGAVTLTVTDTTGATLSNTTTNSVSLPPQATQTISITGPQTITPTGDTAYTATAAFGGDTATDTVQFSPSLSLDTVDIIESQSGFGTDLLTSSHG